MGQYGRWLPRVVAALMMATIPACLPDGTVNWRVVAPLQVAPATVPALAHGASLTFTAAKGAGNYAYSLSGPGAIVTSGLPNNQVMYVATESGGAEKASLKFTSGAERVTVEIPVPASGTIDESFGGDPLHPGYRLINTCQGCNDAAKSMTLDENDNVIVVGTASNLLGPTYKFTVLRILAADGATDTTGFATNGILQFVAATAASLASPGGVSVDAPLSVAHQYDGGHKYVIASQIYQPGGLQYGFFRVDADGTLDTTWNAGAPYFGVDSTANVQGFTVSPANSYVALPFPGSTGATLARVRSMAGSHVNGEIDIPDVNTTATSPPLVAALKGSQVMVASRSVSTPSTPVTTFARLNFGSVVTLDTTFGTGGLLDLPWFDMGSTAPAAITVEPTSQRVAVAGISASSGSIALYLLAATADGARKRATVNTSGDQPANVGGLVLQPSNGAYVVGSYSDGGEQHGFLVRFAKYDVGYGYIGDTNVSASGLIFNPLGLTSGTDAFNGIVQMPDGRLIVVGTVTDTSGRSSILIARFWP